MHQLDCTSLGSWLRGAAVVALTVTVAPSCAHQQGEKQEKAATADKLNKLKSRLEELEKTNGRLSVRIDEMEDDLFLLQDRVEAHRLALRRRDYMNPDDSDSEARAEAPRKTPETNYGGGEGRYPVRESSPDQRANDEQQPRGENGYRRPVKRIPLNESQTQGQQGRRRSSDTDKPGSQQPRKQRSADEAASGRDGSAGPADRGDDSDDSDKVVITDKDFREFARQNSSGSSENETSGGSGDGSADSASADSTEGGDGSSSEASGDESKERVTEEKLQPTDQQTPKDEPRPTEASGANPFDDKSGLEIYKTALAKYRSGEYATALEGFQAFMDGNPQPDYRDNGLYWIGECHFGMGDFRTAVEYFQRLLDEQPDGNKVPDAMLKMALAYRELDMSDKARKLLEKLTRRYPSTNAGRLGEKKLSDLES